MKFDRLEIQSEIVALVKEGPFYPVTYDAVTKAPSAGAVAVDMDQVFVVCNEVGASFEVDTNYGQALIQRRSSRTFSVLVAFNTEVATEAFEDAWMAAIPNIAPDPANGRTHRVMLFLEQAEYIHPTQAPDAPSQTQVRYTINARMSRA